MALVAAGLALLLRSQATSPPLPNPNGYDDLVRAGKIIVKPNENPAALDLAGLRAFVTTNREALRLLRVGLTRPCAVPADALIANFETSDRDLYGLTALATLLVAEGRLAELENRSADAARSYVDAIRLGTEMSRGGLFLNRLLGISREGIGTRALVKLLPKLSCAEMRRLVADLEQVGTNAINWNEVVRNENRFVRSQMKNHPNPIRWVSDLWQLHTSHSRVRQDHALAAARLCLLSTELALRCYRCDQGASPANLQQIVPRYLQRLPADPFSGRPPVYRLNGATWVLYSLGPDGIDDGGQPARGITSGDQGVRLEGDLLYDSPW